MKKLYLFCLLMPVLLSCSKAEIRNGLIGDWDYGYEIRERKADGSWDEWHTIQTYVLVPSVSFTTDGRLLYAGETSTACCTFKKYSLKDNVIKLQDLVSCPYVDCAYCDEWKVISIDDNVLILEKCDIIQEKYTRAQ
ncbi:hypothetical protein [Jiulongibacter sediminis]|jgi:hypothetical protein|uniref:hypothetical protein n=1 Tax=Jiulongibacter sediminis TaxID=1605367 RepID=UPI0026ED99E4|nr:hypothetical protein [Jiulongibacter sediminis]